MLALEERVAQQFALGGQTQQSQQQSPSTDTLRMWQNLLLGGTTSFPSAQQSGINRSGSVPITLPNGATNTTPNSLLNLSSVLGLSNNLQASSSLFGGSNLFQPTQFGGGQHPLYQQGMCIWLNCNTVRHFKLFLIIIFSRVTRFSRLFNIWLLLTLRTCNLFNNAVPN
jgi:hypothetical protein